MEVKKWSLFDIIWFTVQLILLLVINIVLFKTYNSYLVWVVSTFATLFGAAGTWLAVKKYNINYLFGTIHVILYGIIALGSKVFGDFMLNIFIFLPLDIYGWIEWTKLTKKKNNSDKENKIVKKLSLKQWLVIAVVIIVSNILYSLFLLWLNDPAAILDSMSTTLSIFGMWLMVKYYREQWWVWFVVNIVSVGIWIQVLIVDNNMMAIAFIAMWSIYTINSVIGMIRWIKNNDQ